MKTKLLLAVLLATLALGVATPVEAHPRWRRGPRINISVGPRPYYYAPRPVYAAPPPRYYAPRRYYYAPPRPRYYGPPRGYYHGRGHGHWRRW